MIVIESKRKKLQNILIQYPGAAIIDVTSQSTDKFVKLSPFYPHGGIPVPFSDGYTSASVEGIWQGLKVFRDCDVDISCFSNTTMAGLKRTVRRYGPPLGHRKGVNGTELLGYVEARYEIYLPTYKWVLDNKVQDIINHLRQASKTQNIVLLDYATNPDIDNPKSPLSHAFLVKAYTEGLYPFNNKNTPIQLSLFD